MKLTHGVICRMQVHISKQMSSVQAGYVDPQCIAHPNFNYAKEWKLDCKELTARKTIEGKEEIRNKEIRETALKKAVHIALAFKYLQKTKLYGCHTTSSKSTIYLKL